MRSLFILLSLSLVAFSVFAECYRYGNNKEKIDFFYNEVLGRSRSYGEGGNWEHDIGSGAQSWAKVCHGFMLSPEYWNKGKSDSEFLTDLYRVTLNRTPDAKGFSDNLYYLSKQSRGRLLEAFCNSPEGQSLMYSDNGKGCEHNYCRNQKHSGDSSMIKFYKDRLASAINDLHYSYDPDHVRFCGNDNHFKKEIESVLSSALSFIEANERYYSTYGTHYTRFSQSYWSMKYDIQSIQNDLNEYLGLLKRLSQEGYLYSEANRLYMKVVNRTKEVAKFSLGS